MVGAMTRYRTTSGSIYEVDEVRSRVRQLARSPRSNTNRIASEWRTFQTLVFQGVGNSLVFTWGHGRDQYSALSDQTGVDEDGLGSVLRLTRTTAVVECLELDNEHKDAVEEWS